MLAVKELPEEPKDVTVDGVTLAEEGYITMVTRQGIIKKTRLAEFSNPQLAGIIAMQIEDGDELIAVKLTSGRDNIFLASHEGMAIRFPESRRARHGSNRLRRVCHGPRQGRLHRGHGNRGREGTDPLRHRERAMASAPPITEYRLQSRAGKGVINVKTTERNGKVVGVLSVTEESEVMIIIAAGQDHAPRFQHHSRVGPLRPGREAD